MFVIKNGGKSDIQGCTVDIEMIPLDIMEWTEADMTVLLGGKMWNSEDIQCLHSCVSLWIFEWHWHIITVEREILPSPFLHFSN